MVIDISPMRKALHYLYYDRLDVWNPRQTVADEITDTRYVSEPDYRDVPCQTSFPGYASVADGGKPEVNMSAMVTCDPEIKIMMGARIVVHRDKSRTGGRYYDITGRVTTAATETGKTAVGENHQEIPYTVVAVS